MQAITLHDLTPGQLHEAKEAIAGVMAEHGITGTVGVGVDWIAPNELTNPHPKEHHMSAVTDEIHKLIAELEAEGHALADKFRAAFTRLKGDETQLATEAHADAMQVAQDAKPVIAEAEHDAATLASEAAADIKDAAQPVTPAQPEPPAAA